MQQENSPSQQFVLTLFNDNTLEKVKEQFGIKQEIVPIDSFDVNFRLLLTQKNTINLELLAANELGHFFKPIGYYTENLDIFLLNEFEIDYITLKASNQLVNYQLKKSLSFEENAVVAAFSIDVFQEALRYQDCSLFSNGLKVDIFISLEGHPQVFLDDRYKKQGAIGGYFLRGEKKSVNPTWDYKEIFDRFVVMKLLSAFKRI